MSSYVQTARNTKDNVQVLNIGEISIPTVERNLLKPKENTAAAKKEPREIVIDGEKHPESAQHGLDASNSGSKVEGIVDRKGASKRRRENLKGKEKEQGKDRDEFPPAVIKTDGKVSVRLIRSGDNKGSGSSIGHQLRDVPDNTRVIIIVKPPKL
jgi:hypothetical protein